MTAHQQNHPTNMWDVMPEIFNGLSSNERLPFLVIFGLFLIIVLFISYAMRRRKSMDLLMEENTSKIIHEIMEAKMLFIKTLYDLHFIHDRRSNDIDVDHDRRKR